MNRRLIAELIVRLAGVMAIFVGLMNLYQISAYYIFSVFKEGSSEPEIFIFLYLLMNMALGICLIRWSDKISAFLLPKNDDENTLTSTSLLQLGIPLIAFWTALMQGFSLLNSIQNLITLRKFGEQLIFVSVQQAIFSMIMIVICLATIIFNRHLIQKIQRFSS